MVLSERKGRETISERLPVCTWRWCIVAGESIPLHHAWTVGHAMRAMLIRENRRMFGHPHLPACLHHSADHSHAFYISEPDDSGSISHLAVYARGGLDRHAIILLAAARFLKVKRREATRIVEVAPVYMGVDAPAALAGPARVWRSAIPYFPVHEHHEGRPHDAPEAQLKKAITDWRRLAPDVRVHRIECPTLPAPGLFTPASWQRPDATYKGRRIPPQAQPAYFELHFDEPVRGPILLGRGEHFGLGLFLPVPDDEGGGPSSSYRS